MAQVTINDLAGTFVNGSAQDQAATLLHELGHVFSLVYGAASTQIADDGKGFDPEVSKNNTNKVNNACFK